MKIPDDKRLFYAHATQVIRDYLYDKDETYCVLKMYFKAGDLKQSKLLKWVRHEDSSEPREFKCMTAADMFKYLTCSKCGECITDMDFDTYMYNYCPNCGNKTSDEQLSFFSKYENEGDE